MVLGLGRKKSKKNAAANKERPAAKAEEEGVIGEQAIQSVPAPAAPDTAPPAGGRRPGPRPGNGGPPPPHPGAGRHPPGAPGYRLGYDASLDYPVPRDLVILRSGYA